MDKANELKFTYSSILFNKKGEKVVRVCFEKQEAGVRKFAEGVIPEGKIDSSFGFSGEEITQLEEYLKENSADIMLEARKITGITHWLK
ncbi:MAG: hypothetical protein IJN54_13015 [Lachnospiraceae bacterium]|nr:hypothetical protein [Lachnospiraceae bacterium]